MAKPDPIPTFIEVGERAKASVATESETAKPLEEDWVNEFLCDREIRLNTRKAYLRQLRGFQIWCEFKHWAEVSDVDIRNYKAHLKDKPTKSGKVGLSAASINQAIATLQSFFKWLTTKRYITYNPMLNIEKVPDTPSEPKDMEVAAVQQLAEGLEYRGQREQLSVRDEAIFEVLKHGLRAEEVSKLDTDDYKKQGIRIIDAKWGSDGWVPLSPKARYKLDRYLDWCVERGFDIGPGQPLFRNLSRNGYGDRLGYWGIYEMVKDLGAISESTENVHPHRLRHTFGTQLVMSGMPPDYVRKLMRIKSPVTSERYTKRALEKRAENAFNELIEGSESGEGLF